MFQSPTLGRLTLPAVRERIISYLTHDPHGHYTVVVGTDSQASSHLEVDFVTAIVIHHRGHGGIYFWTRSVKKKRYVLRQRMYEEATRSLDMANQLVPLLKTDCLGELNIEIHVDVGNKGQTREMIQEIVGMVRGCGYVVKTKPESYAASKVADRYT